MRQTQAQHAITWSFCYVKVTTKIRETKTRLSIKFLFAQRYEGKTTKTIKTVRKATKSYRTMENDR